MKDLNIESKNIFGALSECKQGFLIPDYQRPYAWGEAGRTHEFIC